MGFDDGRIVLDNENGVYNVGQTVFGRIVFDQGKPKTIHGIYVSWKGFCKVHWTTTRRRTVNKRTHYQTVHHESYEEYIHRKDFIVGDSCGEIELNPGHHEYNFQCPIPSNCPSTFEGEYGHIRYRIKVVMVTCGIFSSNKEKRVAVGVCPPVDLNLNAYCKNPIEYQLNNTYCCWCVNAGSSEIQVKLPVGGYCPGQVIPMEISVVNDSSVEIDELIFIIKQEIKFEATTNPATKYSKEKVATIKKGPIPGRTARNWQLNMEVPAMDVYNFNGCRYIDIFHCFKVKAVSSGCHDNGVETHPIIIGTIPLINFQNPMPSQIPGPVQDVPDATSYPHPIITKQPLPFSPYPNYNYAPTNTQDPEGPPYPIQGSHYNPMNPPQSNPTSNLPPPYPGNDPVPLYPGSGAVPPYPIGNQMPYPKGDSVTPYSDKTGPLKTGTIGFTVLGGDTPKSSTPLPAPNSSYTTGGDANPYASATAPEPSTPGSVADTSDIVVSKTPAYNPDFKDYEKKEKTEMEKAHSSIN